MPLQGELYEEGIESSSVPAVSSSATNVLLKQLMPHWAEPSLIPSGAFISGVTITATNTGTGIVSTLVTNESADPTALPVSPQPGTYKLSAALPGFQTETFTDVALGGAQQVA